MQRDAMLKALEMVAPALGRQELRPQMANLWFDGKYVSAFDDLLGLRAPCTFGVEGGMLGAKLISMIGLTETTRDVLADVEDSNVTVKIGGLTKVKMHVMPAEMRDFRMDKADKTAVVDLDMAQLLIAVEQCIKSAGQDLGRPENYGITFLAEPEQLVICSGYKDVLVKTTVPVKSPPKFRRVVLHPSFCAQLVRHGGLKGAVLELHDTKAVLQHPDVWAYGRALSKASGGKETNYHVTVDTWNKAAKGFFKQPTKMKSMLERNALLGTEHNNMELEVTTDKKGELRLRMKSSAGDVEVVDLSDVLNGQGIKPVHVYTNAKYLQRGIDLGQISINQRCIVQRDKVQGVDMVQIISVSDKGAAAS